ncbi:hypothetical protein DyAD56_23200 [Dyella sp. AD56]|uniref:hypothetical protein n=1 Tax=Dyella sp. AD56 TaxID=1528744 RepID=UPI000C8629BB|nr:hypothetical protein [Dyella sp. AD56]PMQ02660.1 hypothetical protein DyAD56_23200 [Dyella sp. AD56]
MKLKLRRDVLFRVFVNIMFWGLVMVGLSFSDGHLKNVPWLANQDAKVLGVDKIIEIADGEVWLFQVLAGMGALGIFFIEKRWAKEQYKFFKKLTLDDFYPIFLNFGTLFILSGIYRFFHHKPSGALNVALGVANIMFYCFGSNFDGKEFEKDDEEAKPVANIQKLSVDPIFASMAPPLAFKTRYSYVVKSQEEGEQPKQAAKSNEPA